MPASITLNQMGKPPGVAGRAREDLDLGIDVTATAGGGPFAAHLWSLIHRAIDISVPIRATTLIAAPVAPATALGPIDVAGTYLLQLSVDSGAGLGAGPGDIARMTFYAGPALNPIPDRFPRRTLAFQETTEHNVLDLLDPMSGNAEGWSREWYRWFFVIDRLWRGRSWAVGRVALDAMGATLTRGFNIAVVARTAMGVVDVSFAQALPDANYSVTATARGPVGGSCTVDAEAPGVFTVFRADPGGALVDADFNLDVKLGA